MLRASDIDKMSYRELQKNAKARGIRANQSKVKLVRALKQSKTSKPRKLSRKRSRSGNQSVLPAKKLRSLDIDGMSYRELRKNAKARGIPANQSTVALIRALKQSSQPGDIKVEVPMPLAEHSSAKLWSHTGQLWGKKTHPDQEDVLQGKLSNCYFVCALTLLAEKAPEAVERCFTPSSKRRGHRVFQVQVYRGRDRAQRNPDRRDIEYAFKRVTVNVDNQFWVDEYGDELYTHSESGAMWPGLLEKSYIKMRGRTGYRGIEGDVNNEGNVVRVVRAVEPRLGCLITPLSQSGDKSRSLRRLLSGDYVAWCAGSRPHNPPNCSVLEEGGGKYIYGNHAYLVEGIHEKYDETFAIIRNPHNRDGAFDATANPDLLQIIRLDSDTLEGDGTIPLNEDGFVGAALVPLSEFNAYFLTLSSFSWLIPPSTDPIHA